MNKVAWSPDNIKLHSNTENQNEMLIMKCSLQLVTPQFCSMDALASQSYLLPAAISKQEFWFRPVKFAWKIILTVLILLNMSYPLV